MGLLSLCESVTLNLLPQHTTANRKCKASHKNLELIPQTESQSVFTFFATSFGGAAVQMKECILFAPSSSAFIWLPPFNIQSLKNKWPWYRLQVALTRDEGNRSGLVDEVSWPRPEEGEGFHMSTGGAQHGSLAQTDPTNRSQTHLQLLGAAQYCWPPPDHLLGRHLTVLA